MEAGGQGSRVAEGGGGAGDLLDRGGAWPRVSTCSMSQGPEIRYTCNSRGVKEGMKRPTS